MKKTLIIICCAAALFNYACKKSVLDQINPNKPTLESLETEGGIKSFALGVFEKWLVNVPNSGHDNIMIVAWAQQSILGDELFCPYGNYGNRWANQVYSITLPDGTEIVNPNGIDQKTNLQALNSRGALDRNAFQYEWSVGYFMIAQMNLLRKALQDPKLVLSGNPETKKNALLAWVYWWRGYAYSRIGSLYLGGVINNAPADGNTSDNFVPHDAIIAEANKNFDSCTAVLSGLSDDDDYESIMQAIIPSVFLNGTHNLNLPIGIPAPDMWIRNIYTYKARNLVANKKVADMTSDDWNTVLDLTSKGLQQDDNIFVYSLDPNLVNDLNGQSFGNGSQYTYLGDGNQFTFVSERLIQDYKSGDQRFAKGFYQPSTPPAVNVRSRGIQFGTRFLPVSIEDGGLYGTNANLGTINIACTWDENALTRAEALIRLGTDIDAGLQLIDDVRDAQGAGLAHVAGTGLTQAQALEELRSERRVGLFLRGTAFYDARRWGVTAPLSSGGGRKNAIVLVPAEIAGTTAATPLPCTMNYDYIDYWDVPQNELDFNAPATGSTPVKN